MDIIEFLTQDLDRLRKQLVNIRRCLAQSDLRDKIDAFVRSYGWHESLEEDVLFPPLHSAFKKNPGVDDRLSEYESDHRDIWELLILLKGSVGLDQLSEIRSVFFYFSASGETHLGREERLLFPLIRESADPRLLEELGRKAKERSALGPRATLSAGGATRCTSLV